MSQSAGAQARTQKRAVWVLLAALVAVGLADAVALFVIEEIGNTFVPFFYLDVLNVESSAAIMFGTLIGLGLVFFFVMRLVRYDRQAPPEYDLLSNKFDSSSALKAISTTVVVGLFSLLAGAALGPEAMLMSIAASLGAFMSDNWRSLSSRRVWLITASIGGLLAPFGGSMFFFVLPVVILVGIASKMPRDKRLRFLGGGTLAAAVATPVGFYAYLGIEQLSRQLSHTHESVGTMDLSSMLSDVAVGDYVVAVVVGVVAAGFVQMQQWAISGARWLSHRVIGGRDSALRGASFAVLAATVIAAVYWWAGPTVMFSGMAGTGELARLAPTASVWTVVGLLFAKLFISGWSKGAGYYGGLIFPAIYAGLALGIITSHICDGDFMTGAAIGAITGMAGAAIDNSKVKGPIMGAIFVIGVLPFGQLTALALCGAVGAVLGQLVKNALTLRFRREPAAQPQ